MKSKFEFYEVVRVIDDIDHSRPLVGQKGAILGMAQNEQEKWSYAVHLYELRECWSFDEDELESTGRMDVRESFYDGTHVSVIVDSSSGEGRLKP